MTPVNRCKLWKVVYEGGVSIRDAPSATAARLGVVKKGTIVSACEEQTEGGVVFVRLTDGQGWLPSRLPGGGMVLQHMGYADAAPTTFQVVVPAGAIAGSPILVQSPTGAQVQVIVPPNAAPGSMFTVSA